jgi:iron complex outermembrane receptor protein
MSAIHSRSVLLNTSALFGALALSLAAAGGAMAQERAYNIPAETLSQALRDYGRASGRQIIFTEDLVRGRQAPALKGSYPSDAALARLLDGSGLSAQTSPSGAIMIVRDSGPQSDRAQSEPARPTALEEVVVTGSRIRGVAPSSPVITLTQDQIRDAGQTNAGEVFRSIPQNFNGGQNPGVALGASGGNIANQNITGGSTINLRGLGPDATLTLLNGRRLAYDGYAQAIDVSNIPLAAISSIQVVTDGASAIYGSDAVAGVANIILKRDFEGVTTSARYGKTTEGGGSQAQYNIVFGKRWDTGGFIATADYSQQSQVLAGQRDVTANMPPATTLFPSAHQLAGLVSAHQDIGASVHLSIDALYSERKNFSHLDTPFFLADANSDTR